MCRSNDPGLSIRCKTGACCADIDTIIQSITLRSAQPMNMRNCLSMQNPACRACWCLLNNRRITGPLKCTCAASRKHLYCSQPLSKAYKKPAHLLVECLPQPLNGQNPQTVLGNSTDALVALVTGEAGSSLQRLVAERCHGVPSHVSIPQPGAGRQRQHAALSCNLQGNQDCRPGAQEACACIRQAACDAVHLWQCGAKLKALKP